MFFTDRPPIPFARPDEDDRPRFNSIFECTEKLFDSDNMPYPRGNMDKHNYEFHLFMVSSLTPELNTIFEMMLKECRRAEDHNQNVLYVERYLLMGEHFYGKMCRFLTLNVQKQLYQPNKQFRNIEISKLFYLKARLVTKWKKDTWDNVRGFIACKHYFGSYWNNSLLEQMLIKYLVKHPNDAFHKTINFAGKEGEKTKEILNMIKNSNNCFETPHKIISLSEWNNKKWDNNSPGEVVYCPTLIWLSFKLPINMTFLGNIGKWHRTGNIKSGSCNRLFPKLPDACMSINQIEGLIDKAKYAQGDATIFIELRNIIDECVCSKYL